MPSRQDPEIVPLPFAETLEIARLDGAAPTTLTRRIEDTEAEATARYLGAVSVEGLAFDGEIAPWGGRGWRLRGRVSARIVQECVITLEPVVTRLDTEIERTYLPAVDLVEDDPEPGPQEMGPEDGPEPFTETIDLAAAIVETLQLGLDPYPRAPGASLGQHVHTAPGIEALTDESVKPFAKLAALKRAREDDKA
ncbi:MAG: DUF177 domain-containing protein [Pseudomonadota bacterium]